MWISLFGVQEITHLTCSNAITGLIEAFPVPGLNIQYCGALKYIKKLSSAVLELGKFSLKFRERTNTTHPDTSIYLEPEPLLQ